MFELSREVEGKTAIEHAVIVKNKFFAMKDKIDVIRHLEVGINDPDADSTNYSICLICDFDTLDDLNFYATHPAHLEVGAYLARIKLGRACIDYEF